MAELSDLEARLAALEARMDVVAADAAAARHLAAAPDRDLADLGVKVDAGRAVINGRGEQLNARVGRVEQRVEVGFERMETGFAEVRGALDGAAAGQQVIVGLLNRLLDDASEK